MCVVVHCSYALFVCLSSSPLQHCRTTVRACDWTLTVEHIVSFTAIFGKICTAHAQKGLFMNFRCKFRHCRSIRRPRFPVSYTVILIIIGIPSPTHSFTLGLNPSFSAYPPYRSLSFFSFRIHYMDFPDCLLLLPVSYTHLRAHGD